MLETKHLFCDLCVVGGGLSGMAAAISAAREGLKVVLMHELQGLKLREIAAALHMPLATAGSRLRRAKQRLRRDLEGWYFDEH